MTQKETIDSMITNADRTFRLRRVAPELYEALKAVSSFLQSPDTTLEKRKQFALQIEQILHDLDNGTQQFPDRQMSIDEINQTFEAISRIMMTSYTPKDIVNNLKFLLG